jgi:diguanylate cyclase (GGDEF)-like protein
VRPVELLQSATRRLKAGSLDYQIDLAKSTRPNELDDLADAFNAMASAMYASHDKLARRAAFDGLTGLANRASFNERLNSHFVGTDRRSERVSVLFVDVDDFKFVNDTIGHAAGDALLVGVGERLSASVRPGDLVARLGGDEFGIITLGAEPSAANVVAERVLKAFTKPVLAAGLMIRVTVSVGVSAVRPDTTDSATVLSEADFAMYTAKRAGKGRLEEFAPAPAASVAAGQLSSPSRNP